MCQHKAAPKNKAVLAWACQISLGQIRVIFSCFHMSPVHSLLICVQLLQCNLFGFVPRALLLHTHVQSQSEVNCLCTAAAAPAGRRSSSQRAGEAALRAGRLPALLQAQLPAAICSGAVGICLSSTTNDRWLFLASPLLNFLPYGSVHNIPPYLLLKPS